MSAAWAERQRRTNRLMRVIATHLFRTGDVDSEQLYGLCKLTWITNSFSGPEAGYVYSTKIPGLESALNRDYRGWDLPSIAEDVSERTGDESAAALVLSDTGFTNLYAAYRNSSRSWIEENRDSVRSILERASILHDDSDGTDLMREISELPGVPKANVAGSLLPPECLLSPVVFALDPRLRMPLINGREGVKALLARLGVANADLMRQYEKMVELYGSAGIRDAADLDQLGGDLPDFIDEGGTGATKKLLEDKPTDGDVLPLKDEADVVAMQRSGTLAQRRLHNKMTNQLRELLADYALFEGVHPKAMFDVLVRDFDHGTDLLIEAKSSLDAPCIRMAIGQLLAYAFQIKSSKTVRLAVLLPVQPPPDAVQLLDSLSIGVLWLDSEGLKTANEWLEHLCLATPN